ncbi:hypothetical protein DFJ73DRAFT_823667 [Zopfochytrium polystomum]|nr:hypothetical protein DFJ73DRAFT_823667 [Zopfochytrium polystomum]
MLQSQVGGTEWPSPSRTPSTSAAAAARLPDWAMLDPFPSPSSAAAFPGELAMANSDPLHPNRNRAGGFLESKGSTVGTVGPSSAKSLAGLSRLSLRSKKREHPTDRPLKAKETAQLRTGDDIITGLHLSASARGSRDGWKPSFDQDREGSRTLGRKETRKRSQSQPRPLRMGESSMLPEFEDLTSPIFLRSPVQFEAALPSRSTLSRTPNPTLARSATTPVPPPSTPVAFIPALGPPALRTQTSSNINTNPHHHLLKQSGSTNDALGPTRQLSVPAGSSRISTETSDRSSRNASPTPNRDVIAPPNLSAIFAESPYRFDALERVHDSGQASRPASRSNSSTRQTPSRGRSPIPASRDEMLHRIARRSVDVPREPAERQVAYRTPPVAPNELAAALNSALRKSTEPTVLAVDPSFNIYTSRSQRRIADGGKDDLNATYSAPSHLSLGRRKSVPVQFPPPPLDDVSPPVPAIPPNWMPLQRALGSSASVSTHTERSAPDLRLLRRSSTNPHHQDGSNNTPPPLLPPRQGAGHKSNAGSLSSSQTTTPSPSPPPNSKTVVIPARKASLGVVYQQQHQSKSGTENQRGHSRSRSRSGQISEPLRTVAGLAKVNELAARNQI